MTFPPICYNQMNQTTPGLDILPEFFVLLHTDNRAFPPSEQSSAGWQWYCECQFQTEQVLEQAALSRIVKETPQYKHIWMLSGPIRDASKEKKRKQKTHYPHPA